MRALKIFSAVAVLGFFVGIGAPSADSLGWSNKWRVEVSEGANSDGTILFRMTPQTGTAVDIPIAIKNGRGENEVAADIRDGLRSGLDARSFTVETDDGEDVLVKKTDGAGQFELRFVESSVKSVRIDVEKE